MEFQCPDCKLETLVIVKSIELPPDVRSDEIRLQVIRCRSCTFEGVAIYEESRRGKLDSESFDHYGYRLPEADLKSISELIKRCPTPGNARCKCASHQELGQRDGAGRWIKPNMSADTNIFPIKW